ncbi:MAG TPA: transporter, partial [Edaphobacter sp.]|nr:transporter [Edaphobacter sp.]
MPGQMGLNSGITPSPGFSYVNISVNYFSNAFNGPNGSAIPVTGNYNVWAVENAFYYVPDLKVLHGNIGMNLLLTPATGSLDADVPIQNPGIPNLSAAAGGGGLADLWVQPIGLGWHLKRADLQVGEAMMLPTGRYTPGASDNVGTGYFGNHLLSGTTVYITKNKGTSANLFTDWEVHGGRPGTNGTNKTPGQAFTMEWG